MSAAVLDTTPVRGRPKFRRLLLAEWTKMRSVRSTVWSLLLLIVLTLGFTALTTALIVNQWSKTDPADRARIVANPVGTILGGGLSLSQLTICVLGAMVIATEYSTGMIRASLLAEPRRLPMFAAKGVVLAGVVFIVGEIVVFPTFFLGAAILHSKAPVSITDHNVLRSVIGAGLYLCVLSLFSMAIGEIVRHTAAAITTTIGVVFVLPIIALAIPGGLGRHIRGYLPSNAGQLIGSAQRSTNDVLSAWQGFGIFCLWTAGLLGVAVYLLERRDA
jgi:ABC-2 type transport system permease protein